MDRLRVLQLISSAGFFGAENALLELSKELLGLGVDVTIGVIRNSHNPHTELVSVGLSEGIPCLVFNCDGKLDLKTFLAIRSFLRAEKINIIHSHGYKSNFLGLVSSWRLPVTRVATVHNWIRNEAKLRAYCSFDKLILRCFDRIVTVSDEVRREIKRIGVPTGKVRLIHNGINLERFRGGRQATGLRRTLGIPEGEKVVGSIGRLSREKGHLYLLDAARHVLKAMPNTRFLVVGDGPLGDKLRSRTRALAVDHNVTFVGARRDVPELLKAMDVFVLPSLIEATPMALLEAMAAKTPIIATSVGEIPRIIIDKQDGLIVPPANPRALAEAIVHVLENGAMSGRLAESAFKIVSTQFSSRKMASAYLEGVYLS